MSDRDIYARRMLERPYLHAQDAMSSGSGDEERVATNYLSSWLGDQREAEEYHPEAAEHHSERPATPSTNDQSSRHSHQAYVEEELEYSDLSRSGQSAGGSRQGDWDGIDYIVPRDQDDAHSVVYPVYRQHKLDSEDIISSDERVRESFYKSNNTANLLSLFIAPAKWPVLGERSPAGQIRA